MADQEDSCRGVQFEEVFRREMDYVQKRWQTVYEKNDRKLASPSGPTPENELVGLAFSGGGIRSATINMGIAQALHQRGVFDHVDYMSTVSGGGYLGSSISTAMRMLPQAPAENADEEKRHRFARGKGEFPYAIDFTERWGTGGEPREKRVESPFLTWVRNNSNYMATGGFLDFARIGGVLLRGILVNFLVLLPFLLILAALLFWRYDSELDRWKEAAQAVAQAELAATEAEATAERLARLAEESSCDGDALCAERAAAAERAATEAAEEARRARQAVPPKASFFPVAPVLVALFVFLSLVFPVMIRVYKVYKHRQQLQTGEESSVGSRSMVEMTFAWSLTAIGVIALIEAMPILIHYFHYLRDEGWRGVSAGVASGAALAAITVAGKLLERLGGLKQKVILAAVGLLGLVIPLVVILYVTEGLVYGAWGAIQTFDPEHPFARPAVEAGVALGPHAETASSALWLLPGILLIILGGGAFSAVVGRLMNESKLRPWVSGVATVFGAVVGYYLIYGFSWLLVMLSGEPVPTVAFVLGSAAVILLFCFLAVDPNLTGVLGLYRDRLASAYLIGLRKKRDKNRKLERNEHGELTHADEIFIEPDLDLEDICGGTPPDEKPEDPQACPDWESQVTCHASKAPYHIVNTSLNLQGSKDKLLRDRNSDFMMFSKYYYGGDRTGFCKTRDLEKVFPQMDLPTAMAISAAAASPNAGRMTSKPLVALMTLFNIRLGYWVPHPGRLCEWLRERIEESKGKGKRFEPKLWHRFGWRIPPTALLREMFSKVDEEHKWVNLSDGGHIENMAVYELLRRRCRYIICGDGEADADLTFGGLATLMRYARIDMRIEIQILLDDLRLDANGRSPQHAALGRIVYPDGQIGHLLYIKSSFSGNEDETMQEYRAKSSDFPHESTADQFFDEGQFEAYRALGYHMADGLFPPIQPGVEPRLAWQEFTGWFKKLRADLAPRLSARHTALRDQLRRITKLLQRPEFHDYFYELYPKLDERSEEEREADRAKKAALPRITHLVGLQLDLMESAFLNLNLDQRVNWEHPGNEGWRRLFESWARKPKKGSTQFRDAYEFLGHRHSGRFQNFCKQSLDLPSLWKEEEQNGEVG